MTGKVRPSINSGRTGKTQDEREQLRTNGQEQGEADNPFTLSMSKGERAQVERMVKLRAKNPLSVLNNPRLFFTVIIRHTQRDSSSATSSGLRMTALFSSFSG